MYPPCFLNSGYVELVGGQGHDGSVKKRGKSWNQSQTWSSFLAAKDEVMVLVATTGDSDAIGASEIPDSQPGCLSRECRRGVYHVA